MSAEAPPWISKGTVNRAGIAVRNGNEMQADIDIINAWRAAHFVVLNTFQALLRAKTKGMDVKIGQRHKRRNTIFDKLTRLPDMQLASLQDVAGCRLIFHSLDDLYAFRGTMHAAKFKHKLKNAPDKYDYINSPKSTGYRGIHDAYRYESRDKKSLFCQGLLVEIQYRTLIQHAWATANEVIGHVTSSQPKFQRGDSRYVDGMKLASEILARAHEPSTPFASNLSNSELLEKFNAVNGQVNILGLLAGVKQASASMNQSKLNMILVYSEGMPIEIHGYQKIQDALKALFELESSSPEKDVVLVKARTTDEVRLAFRNYFSDAEDFVSLMKDGMKKLSMYHQ